MKVKNKFFLNYYLDSIQGKSPNGSLSGRPKDIFNEMLSSNEHVCLVITSTPEERQNFILLCAAINGEL